MKPNHDFLLQTKTDGDVLRICQEKWDSWTFFQGTVHFVRVIVNDNDNNNGQDDDSNDKDK